MAFSSALLSYPAYTAWRRCLLMRTANSRTTATSVASGNHGYGTPSGIGIFCCHSRKRRQFDAWLTTGSDMDLGTWRNAHTNDSTVAYMLRCTSPRRGFHAVTHLAPHPTPAPAAGFVATPRAVVVEPLVRLSIFKNCLYRLGACVAPFISAMFVFLLHSRHFVLFRTSARAPRGCQGAITGAFHPEHSTAIKPVQDIW